MINKYKVLLQGHDATELEREYSTFEDALYVANYAIDVARKKGFSWMVSIFGTQNELIETHTINPANVLRG